MMNLVEISNGLKDLSDRQLQQMAQGSPSVPPYMIVTEMQRREQMRKEYEAQAAKQPTNKTVAQEMMERFGRPQAPPQQQGPQGIAAIGAPPPQPMARGGIVELQGGGMAPVSFRTPSFFPTFDRSTLESNLPPATSRQEMEDRYPSASLADSMAQIRGIQGADPMDPLAREAAAQYAKQRGVKVNPWEMLANFGFSLAGGDSHSFGKNFGNAGLAALANQQSQRDRAEALAQRSMQDRIGIAGAQGRYQDAALAGAVDLHRGTQAERNTNAQLAENARAAQQKRADDAPYRAAQIESYKAQAAVRDAIAEQRGEMVQMGNALKENPRGVFEHFGEQLTTEQEKALKNGSDDYRLTVVKQLLERVKHKMSQQSMNPTELLMKAAQGDPIAMKARTYRLQEIAAGRAQQPGGVAPMAGAKISPADIATPFGGVAVKE